MQLNSQSLNRCGSGRTCGFELAVYDHSLAVLNSQVFLYGKNLTNFHIQTPLHKINLITLHIQPLFTVNAPVFSEMMMFCYEQGIFLWGKTAESEESQLYEFDGIKFTKMDQYGPVPSFNGPFSFTKFSSRYLLLFNCWNGIQFKNKWYLLDIKLRQWKQIVSTVQIPMSEKSHLFWKNGRGYLLLQNCYDPSLQTFHKNLFYQIKITNPNTFKLNLSQIAIPCHLKEINVAFTQILSVDEKRLIILGGQQITDEAKKVQIECQNRLNPNDKMDFYHSKIICQFDLESFQWNHFYKTIPIKGHHHQIFTFNSSLYTIAGTLRDSLIKEIQVVDLTQLQTHTKLSIPPKASYEQSICYYCECAFTYSQNEIYAPTVEAENETFAPRNRVENKFLRKFSQAITTEFHAIGILCEFLIDCQASQSQINLCEAIKLSPKELIVKQRIQFEVNQILSFKSITSQSLPMSSLTEATLGSEDHIQEESLSINLTKIKLAGFKLGYGLLYVASTQEGHIFVSYSSYSQTDFPESNFKSFSEVFYTIKWNKTMKKYDYSSSNQRNIIFQNVKMHFGTPQVYQKTESENKKSKMLPFFDIYVIGVSNLEKALCIEPPKSKFMEDIKIKSMNKKNSTNSLRKYLRHYYLTSNLDFKLTLQNVDVQFVNVYEKFQDLAKNEGLKEIPTNDEVWVKKNENEETHFSTNNDDVISWKKIEMIEQCKIYEVLGSELDPSMSVYRNVFLYHSKKLLKTIQTKKGEICGVIEVKQCVEIQLNGGNFAHRSEERALMKWLDQIENGIIEERCPSIDEV